MLKPEQAPCAPVTDDESRQRDTDSGGLAEPESGAALLGQILENGPTRPLWPVGEPFIAECVDGRHPTLHGRVLIRWEGSPNQGIERWVPTLHGLAIRKGDRLLVQMPHGGTEPIVIGVVDGFAPRPEPERTATAKIELKNDEVFRVCGQDGQPLVEIIHDDKGPVVRLLQSDTRIDLKGKLSISAAELELSAVKGKVRIEATDDVDVIGETINLN